MAIHTNHLQIWQRSCLLIHRQRIINGNAKFVFFQASGNIWMGLRIDIRIDTNGNRSRFFKTDGHITDTLQLRDRFHIKTANTGFQSITNFFSGFTNTGKHCFLRLTTCGDDASQFTGRHNIKT